MWRRAVIEAFDRGDAPQESRLVGLRVVTADCAGGDSESMRQEDSESMRQERESDLRGIKDLSESVEVLGASYVQAGSALAPPDGPGERWA